MSNNILADLQPQAVFKYFEQICAIPHGSGNVKQISDYLCEFARERNLWFKQDESYNVIIKNRQVTARARRHLLFCMDILIWLPSKRMIRLKIWKKKVLTFI